MIDTDIASDDSGITADTDASDEVEPAAPVEPRTRRFGRRSWKRMLAYGLLPALALILGAGLGCLRWQVDSAHLAQLARDESMKAATESTVKLLSYRPATVDKDLTAARDWLTGTFRDDYTKLVNDVVIPGSKQKGIEAVADVRGAASISATSNHAVVLVFINQTIVVGKDAPASTASSVLVTLDKVHNRWLISQFDPV